ncbi:MAG: mechanosensitive ion channel domain-containing protein [Litorilinea sp.]
MVTNQIEEAEQIIRDLENISFGGILLTVAIAWVLVALIERLFPWLATRLPTRFRFYLLPIAPVLRILILIAAGVRVVGYVIQPTMQNVFAITGAFAVAIGFAFKDYMSSIIAGIVALYEQPYRPGDWVRIGDDYGEVKSVGLRALQIMTPDDDLVTIPHSKIWDSNITNANNGSQTHQCVTEFFLHPHHNADQARAKLHDVAITSPYVNLNHSVVVVIYEKPWATRYVVRAYPVDGRMQFQFITDVTVRGKHALEELGIESVALPAHLSGDAPITPMAS